MPVGISDFRAISSGEHNIGDVRLSTDGSSIEKVNNFAHRTAKNTTVLSVQQNMAVRSAFLSALTNDGRITAELKAIFEKEIGGDNIVRSLTRNEIAACIRALDSGSTMGLQEKICHLRDRDISQGTIFEVKSDTVAAMLKSVNEQCDELRGACQRARKFVEMVRTGVAHGTLASEDRAPLVATMLDCLAEVAVGMDKSGRTDFLQIRQSLSDAFLQGCNDVKTGNLEDGVKAALSRVVGNIPHDHPIGSEIAAVLTGSDRNVLAPSVLKAMEPPEPAAPASAPYVSKMNSYFGTESTHALTEADREAFVGTLKKGNGVFAHGHEGDQVDFKVHLNETDVMVKGYRGENQFMLDIGRGVSVSFQDGDQKTTISKDPKQFASDIDSLHQWFAKDTKNGRRAQVVVEHLCSQTIGNAISLAPTDGGKLFFGINVALSTSKAKNGWLTTDVSRTPEGEYVIKAKVNSPVGSLTDFASGRACTVRDPEGKGTDFKMDLEIRLAFDEKGEPIISVSDGATMTMKVPSEDTGFFENRQLENPISEIIRELVGEKGVGEYRTRPLEVLQSLVREHVIDKVPFDRQGQDELIQLAERLLPSLAEERDKIRLERVGDISEKLAVVDNLKQLVQTKINEVKSMQDKNPLSFKNVLSSVRDWNKAADVAYRLFCQRFGFQHNAVLASELFIDMPTFDGVKDMNATCPDAKKYLDGLSGKVATRLFQVLRAQGVDDAFLEKYGATLDEDFVKTILSSAWENVLNRNGWEAISKDLSLSMNGKLFSAKSTIVPAKRIPGFAHNHKYPDGINGYMCHSFNAPHAVNLAQSTFSVGGKQVFSGVRHGVNSAITIRDEASRLSVNRARAKETVTAAVLANEGVMAKIAALPVDSEGPVKILITSTSLLTPDAFRPIFSGKTSNEREMLKQQIDSWNYITEMFGPDSNHGLEIEVPIPGTDQFRKVKVQPKFIGFNFGVNEGAVKSLTWAIGGWGTSDTYNTRAIGEFRTQVAGYVNETLDPQIASLQPQDPARVALERKAASIKKLMKQIDTLLANHAERKDDKDAYKVVARLNVLTYLIGGTPAWNCKSGKDRTGQLDVESKFLATLIELNGVDGIPEPGAELTPEQRTIFQKIALEGGNHEMQVHNTGLAGFKTGGVDSIQLRLGGETAREIHKGGAEYVKV